MSLIFIKVQLSVRRYNVCLTNYSQNSFPKEKSCSQYPSIQLESSLTSGVIVNPPAKIFIRSCDLSDHRMKVPELSSRTQSNTEAPRGILIGCLALQRTSLANLLNLSLYLQNLKMFMNKYFKKNFSTNFHSCNKKMY